MRKNLKALLILTAIAPTVATAQDYETIDRTWNGALASRLTLKQDVTFPRFHKEVAFQLGRQVRVTSPSGGFDPEASACTLELPRGDLSRSETLTAGTRIEFSEVSAAAYRFYFRVTFLGRTNAGTHALICTFPGRSETTTAHVLVALRNHARFELDPSPAESAVDAAARAEASMKAFNLAMHILGAPVSARAESGRAELASDAGGASEDARSGAAR